MKRPFSIVFSVIAVIAVISFVMFGLLGPQVGRTFSNTSRELVGYGVGGGGGAEPQALYPEAPFEASAPTAYDESKQAITSNAAVDVAQQVERKVIKNADMAVVVKDPEASMKSITALAEELGGYVVSSNLYETSYGPNNTLFPEASISIRIPATKLTEVLDKIKKDAVEVDYENISGQDVTDQYVDLTSRLAAKQAAEKKLFEIMEAAEKTEDVLAVYMQLQQIQSEIELLKGQIKFIDQSAAMSSVSVRLIADETVQPIEIGGWKIQGTAKDAVEDLIFFVQGFVQFLIRFLLNYLWRIVLIILPLYVIFLAGRAVYRRVNKAKVNAAAQEEEKK